MNETNSQSEIIAALRNLGEHNGWRHVYNLVFHTLAERERAAKTSTLKTFEDMGLSFGSAKAVAGGFKKAGAVKYSKRKQTVLCWKFNMIDVGRAGLGQIDFMREPREDGPSEPETGLRAARKLAAREGILKLLASKRGYLDISMASLIKALHSSVPTVKEIIKALQEEGLLTAYSHSRGVTLESPERANSRQLKLPEAPAESPGPAQVELANLVGSDAVLIRPVEGLVRNAIVRLAHWDSVVGEFLGEYSTADATQLVVLHRNDFIPLPRG